MAQERRPAARSSAVEESAVTSNFHRIAGIAVILLGLACASTDKHWQEARRQDTPGAYHRFLRANPDSPRAAEARERLDFTQLRRKPTAAGYAELRQKYPQSPLLAEIRPIVEERVFGQARARGTVDGYREFLAEFPDGPNADRAKGNAEYLESGGFGGRPADLAAFAARHSASDFASEAGRSAASVGIRRQSAFRRVGLLIEVAPETPGADRVKRAFAERAQRRYARTGLALVPLAGPEDPRGSRLEARLTIRHREGPVKPNLDGDRGSIGGILAITKVTLARQGDPRPIWSEEFRHKVGVFERTDDTSILFGATGSRYWEAFYLPIATWSSQVAVREPLPFQRPIVAVDVIDHRAVVSFEDGSFRIVDLSDPAAPQVVAQYSRPRDLTKWNGVRFVDGRVVIFGQDGLEIVGLDSGTPQLLRAVGRSKVGSIIAVERVDAGLLVAGNRGLLLVKGGVAEPQLLIERNVLGAAMRGDRVVFTDGSSLFVSSLPSLFQQKAEAELRLEKGFGASRVRIWGGLAVVLGQREVLLVDVSNPLKPELRARVSTAVAGEINDALVVRGRLFLLGDRGLQVTDASGRHIDDSADVSARTRVSVAGRHLVMIGDAGLQVVDTTPFVVPQNLAAPRP
jgi:hypothetical protein